MSIKDYMLPIFAVSGATALIYEILWIRPLSLVFGNSIYAIGTIIFSFIILIVKNSSIFFKFQYRPGTQWVLYVF